MNESASEIPLISQSDEQLHDLTRTRVMDILWENEDNKILQDELNKKRNILYSRLRELHENPFHNIDHAFAVHGRLSVLLRNLKYPEIIPTRKQLLLLESALRHDDGHVGNRYRQDVVDASELSNEELAVLLMETDFRDSTLTPEDIMFMRNAILATTSWQRMLPKNDKRYRSYAPKILEEKLLVFADVGAVLVEWWEIWQKESEGINRELWKQSLEERKKFVSYVTSLYNELKENFTDRFCNRVEDNLREVTSNLSGTISK